MAESTRKKVYIAGKITGLKDYKNVAESPRFQSWDEGGSRCF